MYKPFNNRQTATLSRLKYGAKEEFLTAVTQSVNLYYYYDSVSTGENARQYEAPTADEVAAFAEARWNSPDYVDKHDAIITQKWLHEGILQSREAWSDIRRTGYPSGLKGCQGRKRISLF